MFGSKNGMVDVKGRIFIPAKFRDELGESFIVYKALDGTPCLFAQSLSDWQALTEKISSYGFSKSKQLERYIYSGAAELSCDAQGRALLPADLRAHASLISAVTVNGMGKRLEIWDADLWETEQSKYTGESMEQLIEEIGF